MEINNDICNSSGRTHLDTDGHRRPRTPAAPIATLRPAAGAAAVPSRGGEATCPTCGAHIAGMPT